MTLNRPPLAVRKVPQGDLAASMFTESALLFDEEERLELAPLTLRYMVGEAPLEAFHESVQPVVVAAAIQVLTEAVRSQLTQQRAARLTLLSRDRPDLSNTGGQPVSYEHDGVRAAVNWLERLGVAVGALGYDGGRPVLFVPETPREVGHEANAHP